MPGCRKTGCARPSHRPESRLAQHLARPKAVRPGPDGASRARMDPLAQSAAHFPKRGFALIPKWEYNSVTDQYDRLGSTQDYAAAARRMHPGRWSRRWRALISIHLDQKMPEISRFFGIIIRMFTETGAQHHAPHLHAYYQDYQAIYRIDTGELLAGFLPRRQQRLVEAWLELYQEELLEDWNLVEAGEPIKKVPPLMREER